MSQRLTFEDLLPLDALRQQEQALQRRLRDRSNPLRILIVSEQTCDGRSVGNSKTLQCSESTSDFSHPLPIVMSAKIGIRPWIDFAFRKIFGKPGNDICLISLLNSILELSSPIESVQFQNPFSLKEFQDDKLVCVDVKATDAAGRIFVVEIQIVVHSSFAKRALYYACTAYADQLKKGQGYGELKPSYSVCLLMRKLWDDEQLHHHYRLVERTTGRVLDESIEIHTVELSKYNGEASDARCAGVLEQWCYWLKNADMHTEEELQELLPGLAFLRATDELKKIQEITEEKAMYDSREKAILDYESNLIDARQEGRQEGELIGGIRLLQQLLNLPQDDHEELNSRSLKELSATMNDLQATLRSREA
jgi:predicted transposase/invertase (TIGR01784 family)